MKTAGYEEMERKFCHAAITGDLDFLEDLKDDPLLLSQLSSAETFPLHLSCRFGHVNFLLKVLQINNNLITITDRKGSSLLHLASGEGHIELIRALLNLDPYLSLLKNRNGETPLHSAVKHDQPQALSLLVSANPSAVRIPTDMGQTILHFCGRFGSWAVVTKLLEFAESGVFHFDWNEFMNLKDDDGNTALHLAVTKRQLEVIEILLSKRARLDATARNVDGLTALDILTRGNPGLSQTSEDLQIAAALYMARGRLQELNILAICNTSDARNALMIVSSLIAAAAFQAPESPGELLARQ